MKYKLTLLPSPKSAGLAPARGATKPARRRPMMVKGTAGALSGKCLEPDLMGKSIRCNH